MTSKRLRIAFVVHDYHRHGGHSRYVVELATRYRQEHEVHVYANRIDHTEAEGIACHFIPAIRKNALTTVLSFIVPATLMVDREYDIIHAQGLCGFHHDLTTAHFCQAGWFAALDQQQLPLTWRQTWFRRTVTGLEKQALSVPSSRRVIAISQRIRQDLDQYYGRQEGVPVIYHGVDCERFHPRNRDLYRTSIRNRVQVDDSEFLALYVGDVKKGLAAAIKAVAMVPHVRLLVVTASAIESFQQLAHQQGILDRVIFHPHSKVIETFFAAADVFVFPTVYEPYGMVISEAMASGLPVITSRSAGAAELIESGVDGLLTSDPWDVQQIAQCLERLRHDSSGLQQMGQAARAKMEPYTWDRTAEQTMAVYQAILAEKEDG